MTALSKIMKSKTPKEALVNIPDGFFDISGLVAAVLFTAGPVIQLLKDYLSPFFPSLMRDINPMALLLGSIVLLLYIAKRLVTGNEKLLKILDRNLPIALLCVFALLMIISTLLNSPRDLTVFGDPYRKEGLVGYLSYIVYLLLMAINRNDRHKKIWLGFFLSTSVLTYIVGIIQHYDYDAMFVHFTFHNSNHYGYTLAISVTAFAMLVILLKKVWQKALCAVGMFLGMLTLLMNNTYGAQLAVYAGSVAIIVICSLAKGKFKAVSLLPIAVIALAIAFGMLTSEPIRSSLSANNTQIASDASTLTDEPVTTEASTGTARLKMWAYSAAYIVENPFFGHGSDATGERLEIESNISDRCHNEYINYTISFGIPAVIFYICAVFAVYLRGLQHRRELSDINLIGLCSALPYLISALVGNTMYYSAPYLFIMLGLGYFRKAQPKQD